MIWSIHPSKIVIEYYFNDGNIDVEVMPYILNKTIREMPRLLNQGWKPNFCMVCSKPEDWIDDFTKKVKFVLNK